MQWVAVTKTVKTLDTNLHVCLQWNETCQPVTLSGYAEWPKVADAVIEAQKPLMLMHFHEMFLGKEHKIWSKPHNGTVRREHRAIK
jgi:hypothetical protein